MRSLPLALALLAISTPAAAQLRRPTANAHARPAPARVEWTCPVADGPNDDLYGTLTVLRRMGSGRWVQLQPYSESDPAPFPATTRDETHHTCAFADANHAWTAVLGAHNGTDVIVYFTTDGGASWQTTVVETGLGTNRADDAVELHFRDRTHGELHVFEPAANLNAHVESHGVWTTTDGGRTWRRGPLTHRCVDPHGRCHRG